MREPGKMPLKTVDHDTKLHPGALEMQSDVLKDVHGGPTDPTPDSRTYTFKLGWVQGVVIPCLLNIWGVMLFLRIAWVVAQAGIAYTLLIIFMSSVVCILTTLSLSAICTNGVVQGGGVYYLVSRSLGAELGASVGIIFAFANAVAASMNTIGFCDSFNDLLRRYGLKIIDNSTNDVRIVGTIAIFLMCAVCAIGMDWESRMQNFLIVIIVCAIFNYIIGACVGPFSDEQRAQGFVGINSEVAKRNWHNDFRYHSDTHHDFFSVFAMYFPAVTGIQSGANICGDLRDPATAIPKGTMLAVLISTTSYVTMAVLCGVAALRDSSGNYAHLGDYDALERCKPKCPYGLHNDYEMMQLMALWDLLIYFGCWAATLSTALTNLLAVPKLIQALGRDQIYPGLSFFSKPYGRLGEPLRGYVLVFIVSTTFLLIADLNTIAPLITNFYLASYSLINFCTFHAGFVRHISWRPQFRFYNKWLSLLGFLLCLAIMMIISWLLALVTVLIFLTLYMLVHYRKPKANWGSSKDAHQYVNTVSYLLSLTGENEAVKSYNPQLLVLSGQPFLRPDLIDLGHLITKPGSFMVVADIEKGELPLKERIHRREVNQEWINSQNYRGFYVVLDKNDLDQGVSALLQSSGLGRLSPNIILIGFLTDWLTKPTTVIGTYFRALQRAYELQIALTIYRSSDSQYAIKKKFKADASTSVARARALEQRSQVRALLNADSEEYMDALYARPVSDTNRSAEPTESELHHTALSPSVSHTESHHKRRGYTTLQHSLMEPESCIDVYWLYDDGGLNLLLPYIISRRAFNKDIPLRIFVLPKTNISTDEEVVREKMAEILDKFRIKYEQLTVIRAYFEDPSPDSWAMFNEIISGSRTDRNSDTLITNSELERLHTKTARYLKLREIMQYYSSYSSFIALSLPLPRKDHFSACLYLAWLEVLGRNMPPMLFIRGNTRSVLSMAS